jgi:hypothetical protein
MPLEAVHLQAQHGHAQACPQWQIPCVARKKPVCIALFTNPQYTLSHIQRNNKSGRFLCVFSSAAARRQFATSA